MKDGVAYHMSTGTYLDMESPIVGGFTGTHIWLFEIMSMFLKEELNYQCAVS